MIKLVELLSEDNPCWDGYKVGNPKTKISSRTGKRVNNCIPINEMGKGDLHYKYIVDLYEKGDDSMKAKIAAAIKEISGNKHEEINIGTIEADLLGLDREDIGDVEQILGIDPLKEPMSEAFFIGEDENDKQEEADVDVECGKCGWKWNTKDSEEDDKYICHKNDCNYDNSYRYANKANNEEIEEYDVENPDDIREFIEFMREYQQQLNEADCDCLLEAKYQGRTVPLGKPMRGDSKKFKVYVKNPKTGKVVKVNFGAKGMNIKKNNPVRRKAFRARHNCANPGPRTKARYWSCRKW